MAKSTQVSVEKLTTFLSDATLISIIHSFITQEI